MTTLSPADFAVRLVTEFCVPVITNSVRGESPAPATELDPSQRATIGLSPNGRTFVYGVDDTPICLDLSDNRSQVWFDHKDANTIRTAVERAVVSKWPQFKLLVEEPMAAPSVHRRVLEGDLGANKVAQLELIYPASANAASKQFVARVYALQRSAGAPPQKPAPRNVATAPAPSADAKKKKGWF